jgi:hypothetical protein
MARRSWKVQEKLDEITVFHATNLHRAFCDACLRNALNISRIQASATNITANAAEVGLDRKRGLCSVCKAKRTVTTTPRTDRRTIGRVL